MIELGSSNVLTVTVVAVIALLALLVGVFLVRQVLSASDGTAKMKEIAASASLPSCPMK